MNEVEVEIDDQVARKVMGWTARFYRVGNYEVAFWAKPDEQGFQPAGWLAQDVTAPVPQFDEHGYDLRRLGTQRWNPSAYVKGQKAREQAIERIKDEVKRLSHGTVSPMINLGGVQMPDGANEYLACICNQDGRSRTVVVHGSNYPLDVCQLLLKCADQIELTLAMEDITDLNDQGTTSPYD